MGRLSKMQGGELTDQSGYHFYKKQSSNVSNKKCPVEKTGHFLFRKAKSFFDSESDIVCKRQFSDPHNRIIAAV